MKKYLITLYLVTALVHCMPEPASSQTGNTESWRPVVRPTAAFREIEYDEEYDKYVVTDI